MYAYLFRILPRVDVFVGPLGTEEEASRWLTAQGFFQNGARFFHHAQRFSATLHPARPLQGEVLTPSEWAARNRGESV